MITETKNYIRKKGIHHQELLKHEDMLFGSENPRTTIPISHEIPLYSCPVFMLIPRHLLFTAVQLSTTGISGLTHLFWVWFTGTNHYLKEYSCKAMCKQLSGLSVFISTLSMSACFTVTEQQYKQVVKPQISKRIDRIQLLHSTEENKVQ